MEKQKFLLGAATAAHQVEGNNTECDMYTEELLPGTRFKEPSGIGCDHYNRYEEDIRMLAEAGLNAYRFSIEWARIQPVKGAWVEKEVRHYKDVLDCCARYGVTPVVTMHHFTTPKWIIGLGGWESRELPGYFADYCARLAEELGDRIGLVCTINEANTGMQAASRKEEFARKLGIDLNNMEEMVKNHPYFKKKAAYDRLCEEKFGCEGTPQTFMGLRTPEGDQIIMDAHCRARDAMKKVNPNLRIGLTLSLFDFQPVPGGEELAEKLWVRDFTHYLPAIGKDDFVGVQNYSRQVIGPEGEIQTDEPDAIKSQMGYDVYPPSVSDIVRRVATQFKGDIYITENGLASTNDGDRVRFINESLPCALKVREDGIPLKGYFYWSLLDNFEWMRGYEPRFGLVEVNRETMERKPKESLYVLGSYTSKIS